MSGVNPQAYDKISVESVSGANVDRAFTSIGVLNTAAGGDNGIGSVTIDLIDDGAGGEGDQNGGNGGQGHAGENGNNVCQQNDQKEAAPRTYRPTQRLHGHLFVEGRMRVQRLSFTSTTGKVVPSKYERRSVCERVGEKQRSGTFLIPDTNWIFLPLLPGCSIHK